MQQANFKSSWIVRGFIFAGLALFSMAVIPAAMGLVYTPDIQVTAQMRAELIDSLDTAFRKTYVYEDKAIAAIELVRARQRAGEYDGITDPKALAARLQDALLEKTDNDRHLRLRFSSQTIPEPRAGKNEEALISLQKIFEVSGIDALGKMQARFGVEDSDIMPGNVGYLRISSFFRPDLAGPKFAAAMTKLAGTRALIIDLRDASQGGHPGGVQLLSSYFFDQRTHLNDIYWREAKETRESWTLDTLDGPRYGAKRPLILQTNRATFSACEEFAYNLQSLKRAIVIGESTGGGAHAGGRVRLTRHFWAGIPAGRAINPVTGTNWEGKGVLPDHVVRSRNALKAAQDLLANRPST